jgi:PAS domain S-box-containing protein
LPGGRRLAELAERDTGTGIPAPELPRIFERFHRIENAKSRTHEGTGIGLALVKELVKLHWGTIEASSVYGEGSVFTIRLPLGASHLPRDRIGAARMETSTATRAEVYVEEALSWLPEAPVDPAKESHELPAAPSDGAQNRPRLLLADDNADMRAYLRSILVPLYEVETVADGVAALEAMRTRRPALAILDVMMPRMDGFAALSELRKDAALKDLPIILLSARAGEEAAAEGLAAGADDYIVKPFSAPELLARARANLTMANLRNEATEAVRASEERYRTLVQATSAVTWSCPPTGLHVVPQPAWMAFTGQTAEEILGDGWTKAVHPEDVASAAKQWSDAVAHGKPCVSELRIRRHDGAWCWMSVYAAPIRDGEGHIVEWFGMNIDITDRKQQEERIKLLLREVNHRAKNMLSLVLAVARQTVAASPHTFLDRFSDRIQALAASQDLLVKSEWKGVEVEDLVRSQLAHFGDFGRAIAIKGPSLLVLASAAQTLGMAIHELATNAGKYGALSVPEGRVAIGWGLERDGSGCETFTISWREQGGPPVSPPSQTGFGSTVIGALAETSLDAKVDLDFLETGLRWRLRCPAAGVVEGTRSPPAPEVKAERSCRCGPRPKVLVVEDEVLVAMEIAHVLRKADFEILGPARAVAQALSLIEESGCDAAVLDINLGGETSEAVARKLLANGTRFLSLSGYSRTQHPSIFADVPALAKPLRPKLLIEEIKKCLGGAEAELSADRRWPVKDEPVRRK